MLLGYLVTKFFGDQEIKNNKLLPINKCFYHTKNGGAIKKNPNLFSLHQPPPTLPAETPLYHFNFFNQPRFQTLLSQLTTPIQG